MSRFLRRRAQLNAVLQSAGSQFSKGRFIRLVALTGAEAAFTFPVTVTVAGLTIANLVEVPGRFRPYISWAYVHTDYWQVSSVPASYWNSIPSVQFSVFDLSRWVQPAGAIIFLALFATTRECRSFYGSRFRRLAKTSGEHPGAIALNSPGSGGELSNDHSTLRAPSLKRSESQLSSTESMNKSSFYDNGSPELGVHIERIVIQHHSA